MSYISKSGYCDFDMFPKSRFGIIMTFYIFIVLFYLLYVNYMIGAYSNYSDMGDRLGTGMGNGIESFSGVVVTTENPMGQCFECTAFYSQLLGIDDATTIMTSITAYNGLFDSFFDSLDTFLQTDKTVCPNVATIQEYVDCLTKYVNNLTCPVGFAPADCVIRENLLSKIVSKAMICTPPSRICKTLGDFQENFVATLASIKEDYAQCKKNFANPDAVCVKQYGDAINARVSGENAAAFAAGAGTNPATTLVTKQDLNNAMYDMTTYVTTIGYKG